MGWLDETPDKDARVQLLVALRDITDGKIFVEAERAKLTRMLAKVHVYPLSMLSFRSLLRMDAAVEKRASSSTDVCGIRLL